ncbi:periplasmic heavy metal sensor [Novosphingobium album (ex Hu et al. 2023)]|uniref:Periplasmic heavy metal sensor n=1 Tax=Novosphingobium album (ex Hu et al. 2023) TaxID=2930093 RepID=A0ABT0B7X8_9SPHN|nr:periplasmic heavy metal sensor [Novosphingobium album (ex Hu et al. 2023)]MCJ2180929.1 periplasmic heavy metal sensor [Novosphingobium album (ex Hu et al. 2023)]
MRGLVRYVVIAVVAFLVALIAVHADKVLFRSDPASGQLHEIVHEKLHLDPQQHAKVDQLEKDFAARRKALEAEMQAANADLAAAIAHEHSYGPDVEKAVDRSHHAMGELQKATLRHIFAMRAVLRPDQARIFDEGITKTLTAPAQD